MTDRTFSLVAGTGETIPLSTTSFGDYALLVGVYGIGVPPVQPRYLEGVSDGGVYRGSRYGMRTMDLPILIQGTRRSDVESKIVTLARILDDTHGLPKLVATYGNGTVYELTFNYVSGLEGDGTESTNYRTLYTLSLNCPEPFWTARNAVQFNIAAATSTLGLLPELAKLQISPSTSLGNVPISNPGDVPAPVTWILTGPGGPAAASLNGVGWSYNSTLAAAGTVTITPSQTGVSVVNQAGTSVYANLGNAPKFFNLPPGDSTVVLTFTDATAASSFAGYYRPRRKVVY